MYEKTLKLYDENAYLTAFEGKVLSCEAIPEGFAVVLDRTAFFPESGGQTSDTGALGGVRVTDVRIDEKTDVITHVLDGPVETGSTVHGEIDWNKRFDKMQQHTGEHIFSGVVCSRFSCDNVGFHLSGEIMTMDYNRPFTQDEINNAESLANDAVWRDLEVDARYPSAQELAGINYRSKKEIEGAIRLVTIPGIDVCACCAPHVRRTGEVGLIKVMSFENHKGGIRVYAACGKRALEALTREHDLITGLARSLSTGVPEVPGAFERMKNDLSEAKRQAAELCEKMVSAGLSSEEFVFSGDIQMNPARRALDVWMNEGTGLRGVFAGEDDAGYSFVIGRGRKGADLKGCDAGKAVAALREKLGAKGGGSPEMAQGSVKAAKEDILSVLQSVI